MARLNGSSNGTNLGRSKARNPEANAAQREICLSLTKCLKSRGFRKADVNQYVLVRILLGEMYR